MIGQTLMYAYCKDFFLTDAWRKRNPSKKKQYTWQRNGIKSRLDHFYVPAALLPNIKNCKIEASESSDHSKIFLDFYTNEPVYTETLWKCNSETIEAASNEIILAIKNINKDKEFWWDTLKFRFQKILKKTSEKLAVQKNQEINSLKTQLESQLKNNEPIENINDTKKNLISKLKEKSQ